MTYDLNEGPYSGFLLIKCDECGEVSAYCAKTAKYAHICRVCGEETLLEYLRPAYMICKCGGTHRYLTNIKSKTFTHNCLECGREIKMELGHRGTAYVTTGMRRPYKGGDSDKRSRKGTGDDT